MSDRLTATVRLIEQHHRERGYAPTVRWIAGELGVVSSVGNYWITHAEAAGYVVRDPLLPRSLRLTEAGRAHLAAEEVRRAS